MPLAACDQVIRWSDIAHDHLSMLTIKVGLIYIMKIQFMKMGVYVINFKK